ncbi:MAG: hypothetical protein ABL927_04690 [Bdellovibrionales bacterium]
MRTFMLPKTLLSILIVNLLVSLSVQAEETSCVDSLQGDHLLTISNINSALKIRPVYFSEGKFKGKKVDLDKRRPVSLLNNLETDTHYFVSQFEMNKKFWVARLPKRAVKNVIFQLALFSGPAGFTLAHAQLRFQTDEAIKLLRVVKNKIVQASTNDFVFSVQAALPIGAKYEVEDAVLGSYKLVSRLVNTPDRVLGEEIAGGDIVTQYDLDLTPEDMNRLLFTAVIQSDGSQLSKNYFAINQNCISVTFEVIDKTLGIEAGPVILTVDNTLQNGSSPNEKLALDELIKRNLTSPQNRLPNYDKEKLK